MKKPHSVLLWVIGAGTFGAVTHHYLPDSNEQTISQKERPEPHLIGDRPQGILSPPRPNRRPAMSDQPIKDPKSIDLAHAAILAADYSGDYDSAFIRLTEDLQFIGRVDNSLREQDGLLWMIIHKFLAEQIDESTTAEDLIRNVVSLREAIAHYLPDSKVESQVPVSNTIRGLVGEVRHDDIVRFAVEKALSDPDPSIIRLAGELKASTLFKGSDVDLEGLSQISDGPLRQSTTRALFLRNHGGDVATSVSLAAFYLSKDCEIGDERNIANRLFGPNIVSYPEEMSTVILEAPAGIKRDRAIQLMIFRIAGNDMESALIWLDHIHDQGIKRRAVENIEFARNNPKEPAVINPPIDPLTDPFAPPASAE